MKIKVKYSLSSCEDIVDLTEFGYDEDRSWEDLTEKEKDEVRDNLTSELFIYSDITEID